MDLVPICLVLVEDLGAGETTLAAVIQQVDWAVLKGDQFEVISEGSTFWYGPGIGEHLNAGIFFVKSRELFPGSIPVANAADNEPDWAWLRKHLNERSAWD